MDKSPNKIGRFKISRGLLVDQWQDTCRLISQFVFVRIEWLWNDTAEVTAFSELFEENPPEMIPPEYVVTIDCSDPENPQVSVKRA